MYSNIIVYQKYLVTSIKVGCATHSLYASSGPKAEGVLTNNQRGWGSDKSSEETAPYRSKQIWKRHISCENRSKDTKKEINLYDVNINSYRYQISNQYFEIQL